jgi:CDP-diglyceride synthetase
MILTMMPLILAGITNMLFTKTKFYQKYNIPMDGTLCCKDGRRVFGDNKTWIGFVSMIALCMMFQALCGFVCIGRNLNSMNDWYSQHNNTLFFNLLIGLATGFVYMISELPNSFIKRRLNIAAGKTGRGIVGLLFFIIDQIDSLVGVMLVLYFVSGISVAKYFAYVIIGGVIHLLINATLYLIKVRRNV